MAAGNMAAENRGKRRKGRRGANGARANAPWAILGMALFILGAGLGALGWIALGTGARVEQANREADAFSREYWQTPIPPQGAPPPGTAPQATGLEPTACALCHLDKYQDWAQSLHAHAMGPGVLGQFPGMGFGQQAECLACHAPMAEQWAQLPTGAGWQDNTLYDAALRDAGITCAACHLRAHRRHGPPTSPQKAANMAPQASNALHGPATRTPHFQASEFCRGCHQHPATSLAINGKPVENTYNEWLESPAARKGITCQQCHMPGGRHQWLGIHDVEMTRSGVTEQFTVAPEKPRRGEAFSAALTLTNTGTGHAFPTYTTPAVHLRAALLDAENRALPGYYAEVTLQRRLDMGTTPWSELADTRLLPGQSATVRLEGDIPAAARFIYLWAWVEPDNFYTGFFQARLSAQGDFPGRAALEAALRTSESRAYLLFRHKVPIP